MRNIYVHDNRLDMLKALRDAGEKYDLITMAIPCYTEFGDKYHAVYMSDYIVSVYDQMIDVCFDLLSESGTMYVNMNAIVPKTNRPKQAGHEERRKTETIFYKKFPHVTYGNAGNDFNIKTNQLDMCFVFSNSEHYIHIDREDKGYHNFDRVFRGHHKDAMPVSFYDKIIQAQGLINFKHFGENQGYIDTVTVLDVFGENSPIMAGYLQPRDCLLYRSAIVDDPFEVHPLIKPGYAGKLVTFQLRGIEDVKNEKETPEFESSRTA